MRRVILFIYIPLIMAGCELHNQEEYQEYYAVEGYLIANQKLPVIRVTTTQSVNEIFYWDSVGVYNANVEVSLLDNDSSVVESYEFTHKQLGLYGSIDKTTVKPKRWYKLRVTLPDGTEIEAQTFVPGTFSIVQHPKSTYTYQDTPPIEMVSTRSSYPGRQTFYYTTISAENTHKQNLTPFYSDLLNKNELNIRSFYKNTIGIKNEKSYRTDEDGNVIIKIPWSAIPFYGKNKIMVNAIDDNLYDFLRSGSRQMGGVVSLSLGEIQNMRYNINGGIGIFGSMASVTTQVEVNKDD